jgi:hypothetical protein
LRAGSPVPTERTAEIAAAIRGDRCSPSRTIRTVYLMVSMPAIGSRTTDAGVPAGVSSGAMVTPHPIPTRLMAVPTSFAVARDDGQVELVAADPFRALLVADRLEPQLHVGDPAAYLGQGAAHDVRALAERDSHPQQAGDLRPGTRQGRLGRPQFHQDSLGVLHQRSARRGEGDVVAGPVDERGTRLGLERGQLLGHGRPGVPQATGGRGDGSLGHHRLEHDQLAHVQHVKRHIH